MKHQKQLNRHNPEAGVWGDCWRTSIACLLDLEPGDVPHFYDKGDKAGRAAGIKWLRERGYDLASICFDGAPLENVLNTMRYLNEGVYWMLTGKSRNNVAHVVVCQGGEIICDTSIDNSGIVGPCDDGTFWAEFITVRGKV